MNISHLGRDSDISTFGYPRRRSFLELLGVPFPHGRVSQLWMAGPVCVSNPYGVEGGLPPSGRSWARQAGPPHNRISPPPPAPGRSGDPLSERDSSDRPLHSDERLDKRTCRSAGTCHACDHLAVLLAPRALHTGQNGGEGQSPARRSAYTHSGPREAKKHARIQHKHARQQLPLTHTNLNQINSSHGHSRHSQHG